MMTDTETVSDRRHKAAQRVLDALDRWSERLEGRNSQKREHPRKPFRSTITIHLPEMEEADGRKIQAEVFQAWARNISCGGVSFIFHEQIKRKAFAIGLANGNGTKMWFLGEVTRARQVHEGFWEYGVRFLGRADM